jgi:hypothetical protein
MWVLIYDFLGLSMWVLISLFYRYGFFERGVSPLKRNRLQTKQCSVLLTAGFPAPSRASSLREL